MSKQKNTNSANYSDQLHMAQESFESNDFQAAIDHAVRGLERTMTLNSSSAKKAGEKLEEILALAQEALLDEVTPDNEATLPTTTIEDTSTETANADLIAKEVDQQAIQDKWSFLPLSPTEIVDFDSFSKSKVFGKGLTVASIETWLASYTVASKSIETPIEVTSLMTAIVSLETDLTEARDLPPKFRDFAISGIQLEIAEKQAQLSEIPSNATYAFKALVLWPIAKALFDQKALRPAGKRSNGNGKLHPPDYEGSLKLVKDYSKSESLPYGGKVDVQAFVYGPEHAKVLAANLSIPSDMLGVFNLDGVLQGTVSAQAKSGAKTVIAVCYAMGVPANDTFEDSFTTSGPIGWHESQHQDNGSKELLEKFQPATLKASLLSNGQNKEFETETAGSKEDTEPELAK